MSLRETMPQTAEFIDALRDVFGKDAINAEIRKGIGGFANHFHATENGQESGTAFDVVGYSVSGDALLPCRGLKK